MKKYFTSLHPAFRPSSAAHLFLFLLTFLFLSCRHTAQTASDPDIYYTCAMDPQVIESHAGNCPICHMALTPVHRNHESGNRDLKLSAAQARLGNIRTDTLRGHFNGNQLILTGALGFDQTRSQTISSRITGRIEKLYYRTKGAFVPKGAKLYDLYSEELNTVRQEYVLAIQKRKVLGNSVIDYDQLIANYKTKLLLWGMTEDQLRKLAAGEKADPATSFYSTVSGTITDLYLKEGDYAAAGAGIFQLTDLSSLWVEAQVYASQLSGLNTTAKARIEFPGLPGKKMEGAIGFVNPEINPDTRIDLIRVNVSNKDHDLQPGMPAYVILKDPPGKGLSLPVEAVLRDGPGTTVWVQTRQLTYTSRKVETGEEADGFVEIRSGLSPGEIVVTSGAWLLQSEYILRKGAGPQ